MLIRRSSPVRNFTILPNEFLQDERLTWAARGLLAEILSRPPGWTATADSMSAHARQVRPEVGPGEGRRAVRAIFAEGKRFGYIVAEKERIGPGEDGAGRFRTVLAFYDTPQPGTASGTSVRPAETPKGQVAPGTASGTSASGTSIERTEEKEPRSTKDCAIAEAAATAAAPEDQKQAAIAEVRADAPTPNRDHQVEVKPTIPTQQQPQDRRSPIQQRDDDWRAQIAAAAFDDLQLAIGDYETSRGSLWEWAQNAAGVDMGLLPGFEWEGREEEQFRAAYLWLLKKHADDDQWLDVLLEPLDQRISAPEPEYEWIEYCTTPPGLTNEAFAEQMRQTIRGMSEEEWGPQIAEIRRVKPGIWAQCRQAAKEYLRGRKIPVKTASMNVVAMQLAVNHYEPKGKWPAAIVPPSLRSSSLEQGPPPAWAA